MKRKAVRLGPSTLVVSLPSKWIKEQKVNPGSELDIVENNNKLTISTNEQEEFKNIEINLCNTPILHKRILAAKYMEGYDEITIKVKDAKQARAIQNRVDGLIGMEIIEQTKEKLVLKDMGTNDKENIQNIIRRIFFLLKTISNDSLEAIKNKEQNLEYLEDMEKNVNKFTEYCFRVLNKKGYQDKTQTAIQYCMIFLLENLGDEYKDVVKFINNEKIILSEELTAIFKDINKYHEDVEKLYFKYSHEDAEKLAKTRDKLISKTTTLIKKTKNPKEAIILKLFENIISTIIKIMNELMNLN